MAKPRIFVSSTYFDLKHIRNSLESFIDGFGYEAVLFESGDIVFHHDKPIDESCYSEIANCHMLVLIIGGRYGSASSTERENLESIGDSFYEKYNSVTKKEYQTARVKDIPIFIFVEKNVMSEYQTYKDNRKNTTVKYAHVDNVNVYLLLDEILSQRTNNFVKDFEKFSDISNWLKDQWAGMFTDFLNKTKAETSLKDLSSQISELNSLSRMLREYSESIIRKIQPENFQEIIQNQTKILKETIINRFVSEGLIDYLIDATDNKISKEKLFSEFEKSENLESFLERINIDTKRKVKFLNDHGPVAKIDFEHIKQRYFDKRNQ